MAKRKTEVDWRSHTESGPRQNPIPTPSTDLNRAVDSMNAKWRGAFDASAARIQRARRATERRQRGK